MSIELIPQPEGPVISKRDASDSIPVSDDAREEFGLPDMFGGKKSDSSMSAGASCA